MRDLKTLVSSALQLNHKNKYAFFHNTLFLKVTNSCLFLFLQNSAADVLGKEIDISDGAVLIALALGVSISVVMEQKMTVKKTSLVSALACAGFCQRGGQLSKGQCKR